MLDKIGGLGNFRSGGGPILDSYKAQGISSRGKAGGAIRAGLKQSGLQVKASKEYLKNRRSEEAAYGAGAASYRPLTGEAPSGGPSRAGGGVPAILRQTAIYGDYYRMKGTDTSSSYIYGHAQQKLKEAATQGKNTSKWWTKDRPSWYYQATHFAGVRPNPRNKRFASNPMSPMLKIGADYGEEGDYWSSKDATAMTIKKGMYGEPEEINSTDYEINQPGSLFKEASRRRNRRMPSPSGII